MLGITGIPNNSDETWRRDKIVVIIRVKIGNHGRDSEQSGRGDCYTQRQNANDYGQAHHVHGHARTSTELQGGRGCMTVGA